MKSNIKGLGWEFGDAIFWLAFGGEKPFPACVIRRGGRWDLRIHPHRQLSKAQNQEIEDWFVAKQHEMEHMWNANLDTQLNWPKLTRQKNEERGDKEE